MAIISSIYKNRSSTSTTNFIVKTSEDSAERIARVMPYIALAGVFQGLIGGIVGFLIAGVQNTDKMAAPSSNEPNRWWEAHTKLMNPEGEMHTAGVGGRGHAHFLSNIGTFHTSTTEPAYDDDVYFLT